MDFVLTQPQHDFVSASDQFPALVAGFGAGKTHAGVWRAITKKLAYPKQNVAYYLPTYDLVARTGFPRFEEIFDQIKIPFKLNKNEAVIEVSGCGQVIFRTMDAPARIVSFEVADSICDELDTLPIEKARDVWNKVISRNRQKKPDGALNTVGCVTTPEGFRFVYERWVKNKAAGYRLIKATTQSNAANLPAGYIDSLRNSYPTSLLSAYLNGDFVNLTSGSIYPAFDRALNSTFERIQSGEPLHIGMDFNVAKGAAVVHVLRDGKPLALDELTDVFDTPAMIVMLKKRFAGHQISVYPDASGGNRKSNNASESDLSLLRQAQFRVCVNPSNPAVKDRVLSMNKIIEARDYLINPDTCPVYVEGLEKQAYNKHGEPDKTGGLDHAVDSGGYFITYKFPVVKRIAVIEPLRM